MRYGEVPHLVGKINADVNEMMSYQYMPIKLQGMYYPLYEDRLLCFDEIIKTSINDFKRSISWPEWFNTIVYITAKNLYQKKEAPFNRPGYHSDGFMTDDINYIWSNCSPTIFNSTDFNLTMDDRFSLREMQEQAIDGNEFWYPDNSLLRLNQYNIHKVNSNPTEGMRCFVKISFSKDKYDLIGNTHNHELDYDWDMKPRNVERNIPQSIINPS